MLHLDVTSSCKSPMSTGVQRVVRALHRSLRALGPVQPLIWDEPLAGYCRLSAREQAFLEPGHATAPGPAAEPEHAANPWPWTKMQRHFAHRLRRLDLAALWRPGDTLFIPEIFQDRRIEWLAALPRPNGTRRVAFFHDAIVWRHPELCPPRRHARFEDYMVALADFDEIVTNSEQSASDLRDFWRTRDIANPPTISPHALAIDEAGGARPEPRNAAKKRVLCVGTLEARKNHLALLAAAEKLWAEGLAFELEFIGRTTRHWGGRVLAEVECRQSEGRAVHWRMHVDDATLRHAYSNCRFTIFPSLVEGFGLPILESVWHGKPCICADRGAIAETAAGGGCRTINVTSSEAIADAMRELLTNDNTLDRLVQETAVRRFPTWDDYAVWLGPKLVATPDV